MDLEGECESQDEYYNEGDWLIRRKKLYLILSASNFLGQSLGLGDVEYQGKEFSFLPKYGLIIEPWKEYHGNVVKRGYIGIDDNTARNKVDDWLEKDNQVIHRSNWNLVFNSEYNE